MRLADSTRLAVHIFSHNKLRTVLTVLAVSIGIGVIVFLISLGYGLQELTIARIGSADSLLSIDVQSIDPEKPLDSLAKEKLEALEGVEKVDPVVQVPGHIETIDELIEVGIWGISENFFDLEGISFQTGKSFTDGVVLSTAAVELLGINPDQALGQEIDLKIFSQSSGITADEATALGLLTIEGVIQDSFSPIIYISRAAIESYVDQFHTFKVKFEAREQVEAVKTAIGDLGYQAQATLDDVDELNRGFRIARIVLGVFGLVALIVSSIGMLNTMTISLLERIKEIGIMKALGASDSDIWKLFLTESSLIGGMGGILGLILGYSAGVLFNIAFNIISVNAGGPAVDLFSTPFWFGLGIIIFAIVVGIITGLYPARRAASLNPLQALRYE